MNKPWQVSFIRGTSTCTEQNAVRVGVRLSTARQTDRDYSRIRTCSSYWFFSPVILDHTCADNFHLRHTWRQTIRTWLFLSWSWILPLVTSLDEDRHNCMLNPNHDPQPHQPQKPVLGLCLIILLRHVTVHPSLCFILLETKLILLPVRSWISIVNLFSVLHTCEPVQKLEILILVRQRCYDFQSQSDEMDGFDSPDRSADSHPESVLKIVILGEPGVGKVSKVR